MKTHPLNNRRGMALVVVLVFLVLLSIFVVGFFSNSQDELTAAQSFTGEVSASHLSESAVSVVMGQIREATSRNNAAWGSQPGMIRSYGEGEGSAARASDKAAAFYKLYSSDDMIVSGKEIAKFDPMNDVAEGAKTGWEHVPALWTNLNEPVTVEIRNANGTTATKARYPILDPSLDRQVEGLEFLKDINPKAEASSRKQVARMPVRWLYVLKDGSLTAPSGSDADGTQATWKKGEREPTPANPIVGRIAFWTDDETCKVNINTAGGYTLRAEDKPDDGGKPKTDARGGVFSEDDYAGSFWDTPRALTVFDRGMVELSGTKGSSGSLDRGGLALSQPVRGEFQRYPGHPSTTSLGIVFRGIPSSPTSTMQDAPYLLKSGQLALLAPRLMFSTTNKAERASNYGTDRLLAADYRDDPDLQSNDQPVAARVKRLYSSVDELFYAQPDKPEPKNRKQNDWEIEAIGKDGKKVTANDDTKILTPEYLEKMRFFLTAHSRAPEVNLFGQPRVTLWPVWEVASGRTEEEWWNASDRLIAFCSTIGPLASAKVPQQNVLRYIFQRKDAYSPTVDIGLERNRAVLTYLRRITGKSFPGFGGPSFEEKYKGPLFGNDPNGREQILVEMFDYIRTVNLRDSTRDKKFNDTIPAGKARTQKKEQYKYAPRGLVVPASSGTGPTARHGFGRFPTISEASIVLYCSGFAGADGKRYRNSRLLANGDRIVSDLDGNPVLVANKPVKVKDTLVRAFFITETFNPMQGYAPTITPSTDSLEKGAIAFEITNLNEFELDTRPLAMPATATNEVAYSSGSIWGGRNSGGSEGFLHTMWAWPNGRPKAGVAPGTAGLGGAPWYPFQTNPLAPGVADPTGSGVPGIPIPYESSPGVVKKTAMLKGPAEVRLKMTYTKTNTLVRDIKLDFSGTVEVPVPTDRVWSNPYTGGDPNQIGTFKARHPGGYVVDPSQPTGTAGWACNRSIPIYNVSYAPRDRSPRSLGDWVDASGTLKPGRLTWIQNDSHNHMGDLIPGPHYGNRWQQILQPGDVVRSVVAGDPKTGRGDLRVSCLSVGDVSGASAVFTKHPDYANPGGVYPANVAAGVPVMHAQSLRMADSQIYYPDLITDPVTQAASTTRETRFGNIAKLPTGLTYPAAQAADLPVGFTGVRRRDDKIGDFDTGIGSLADGPFCNKADEGNLAFRVRNNNSDGTFSHWTYPIPYFTWAYEETFETFFSPNRQTPSPVVFGSLLSGKGTDWQTLCFSPNPAGNTLQTGPQGDNHPGRTEPKDYLWLDLFTMPVVEPYAISEPFSTAGKINLNYPIVPFAHIKRSTGLRAALQPVRVTGMPVNDVTRFKTGSGTDKYGVVLPAKDTATGKDANYRYLVDRDQTVQGFDEFFDEYKTDPNKGFIKTAAQICDFYLYPRRDGRAVVTKTSTEKGDTKIKAWWFSPSGMALTGDNVREKPYADLYPRITTKSNTFCVHVRAQALRHSAASDASKAAEHYRTWDEKRDRVIGEYRGASIIERYIDPQDERFDKTINRPGLEKIDPDLQSIDRAYRFRVLNTKRFDP